MKKSFLIYIDSLDILDELSDEEAGRLFKAIKSAQKGEPCEHDTITRIAFAPFKAQFARDLEKYEIICNRNKNNGLKGGRPKTEVNQKNPVGSTGGESNPENHDSDSGSDSGSGSGIKRSVMQRFTPPTHEEALQYFQEKGFNNPVEASKFVDFYEMKGWMVGKNKMKDWKAAIRNWTKNMTPVAAQQQPKRPRAFGS